jgi:Skp family chaperone for outer membrane proteins
VAVGVLALGFAIVATHRLAAQNTTAPKPGTTAPAPTTKVALLNLSYVIKNYKKTDIFTAEMKEAAKLYKDKDDGFNRQAEALAKENQDSKTTQERREKIDQQMKDLKRQSEDNKAEAQKVLGKKQEQQIFIIYSDIHRVVDKYAQAHGFDMVLHYNDATTSPEYWSAANIMRKIQAGTLIPMYYAPGLDISNNILTTLNAPYQQAAPAGGGAAPAGNKR